MYFDRNRATLIASSQTLTELAVYLTSGQVPAAGVDPWVEANIFSNDAIDPTVAGIVKLLEQPARSVMLEQFDGDQVAVTFVAFDRAGRATIMSGVGSDVLSITATRFDLLPAMLTQTLRINPSPSRESRTVLETTAGVVEQILAGGNVAAGGDAAAEGVVDNELTQVLGSFRHAWRTSGSWHNKPTDRSMTVLFAGPEGFWTVTHAGQAHSSVSTPETPVQLTPCSVAEITRLLGDVVTGRANTSSLTPSNSKDQNYVEADASGVAV